VLTHIAIIFPNGCNCFIVLYPQKTELVSTAKLPLRGLGSIVHLRESDKECYILGDFNIDLLKHEKCEYSARFLNQMMSSMLLPIISKPTRIRSKTATLIDNIFTNSIHKTQLSGIILGYIVTYQITCQYF
jgi:hypothetical protein